MSAKEAVNVILNGDDYGFSPGVNRGIEHSIEAGILTSTSVMVNRSAANEARELVGIKGISVGLHLDLTEEGLQRWLKIAEVLTWPKVRIAAEFDKQIEKFIRIVGKPPDHIDSHHHIHWITGFKPIVLQYAEEHKIPVRCVDARFEMGFYGRSLTKWNDSNRVSPEKLITVLSRLKPGVHEIMCHPGYVDEELTRQKTLYLAQREDEVDALTSPRVKAFLKNEGEDINLINWNGVRR